MKISISDSFLDALRALDRADARRAVSFAEKLVTATELSSLRMELVHDARERAVRSFRVTRDMRAIAHLDCGRLLLLFVARHDVAYAWARSHCIECLVDGEDVRVRLSLVAEDESKSQKVVADGRACCVETLGELHALLRQYGIAFAHP